MVVVSESVYIGGYLGTRAGHNAHVWYSSIPINETAASIQGGAAAGTGVLRDILQGF